MRKFVIIIASLIITVSLLIPTVAATDTSYTITFPENYEQRGENEWQTDSFMINDEATTVLASINFSESKATEEYVFSEQSLALSKELTKSSKGFVKFIDEPATDTVSPNNYRCIYQSYIVNNDGIESTICRYSFYSATQHCYIIFVASDPLFSHVEKTAEQRIVDTLTFEDDFFSALTESPDTTKFSQESDTTTETPSKVGLIVMGLIGILILIAFIFALHGSLNKKNATSSKAVDTVNYLPPEQKKANDIFVIDYSTLSPEELIDDITFIKAMRRVSSEPWNQYDFLFAARGYGWDMMLDWADYMAETDLDNISQVTTGSVIGEENDITNAYLSNGCKCKQTPELSSERGVLSVAGLSKTLRAPVKIVWVNQTRTLRVFTLIDNNLLIAKYVETAVRRTFGTAEAMKLGKPISEETPKEKTSTEPVKINGMEIHINSADFINWKSKNSATPQYEFTGSIALRGKDPVISLYEDGTKTREYCLQTEGEESFDGKYFLTSVRLGVIGNPPAPTMQLDGFISDTPDERKMENKDIGYRMEGHYLTCGGNISKQRYEAMRGQDLPQKALKYPGFTTPANIRLVGICPECGKSFAFHGYAFYMMQNDVAYSDDGLYCCQISSYDEDIKTKVFEVDGKTFRYYNSFCCPHCNAPYIDYGKYPENKVFGVSGCVHLNTKHYKVK